MADPGAHMDKTPQMNLGAQITGLLKSWTQHPVGEIHLKTTAEFLPSFLKWFSNNEKCTSNKLQSN